MQLATTQHSGALTLAVRRPLISGLLALCSILVVWFVQRYVRSVKRGGSGGSARRSSSGSLKKRAADGSDPSCGSSTEDLQAGKPRFSEEDVHPRGAVSRSAKKGSSSSKSKRKGDSSASQEGKPREGVPDFILLIGIPGSGKSTWAKEYVFKCDASFTIVSSDDIRRQLTGSVNDQTRNDEVWDIVLNQVVGHLKMKRNVILDATNVRTDQRRVFVRQLPDCNLYAKVFSLNKSIAKQRIAKDIAAGVDRSDVPDVVFEKMHASFVESQSVLREEGWIIKY